ncbi:universal stress protein, partial [Acinetobacter baumannii]|uniref:universal stress protein n=1 Tax=Acinetobacter baumannii TaxID=470 RepID=UPI00165F4695
ISSDGILKAVEELGSDLIVIGSHGRKGFQKLILGSFAQDVLNTTKRVHCN